MLIFYLSPTALRCYPVQLVPQGLERFRRDNSILSKAHRSTRGRIDHPRRNLAYLRSTRSTILLDVHVQDRLLLSLL